MLVLKKIRQLFAKYPSDTGVHPDSFKELISCTSKLKTNGHRLAVQSVSDKFYFLLFGAICARMKKYVATQPELIIVRSVNGSVGTGWIAELKRSAPIAWLWSKPWQRAYGELISGVAFRCATWGHPLHDLADWLTSKKIWLDFQKQTSELSLRIKSIEVADLIIDSYLRFKPSPQFDAKNPFTRRLIWQALRDLRQADAYFRRAKPLWYFTSYTTYLEHGIPVRVALRHGVEVWSFGSLSRFSKKLTLTDTFHTPDFSSYRSDFATLDKQEERLEAAKQQLETRLSGGIDDATSYMRRSAYGLTQSQLPAGLKDSAIIFLHDFYDSPHVYPDLVFHNFWSWTCTTIETLQKADIPFFLKPHPNQIPQSDEVIKRLQLQYPDLRWLPSNISNVQLAKAGIACGITVYGTVAHELAYLGIPSIGCARHPHHTFDFCRTARTQAEYEGLLKTHAKLPVPIDEMKQQALAFYYMHNLHGELNEKELTRAFVSFWTACNIGNGTEEEVLNSFQALIQLPAFYHFIEALALRGITKLN